MVLGGCRCGVVVAESVACRRCDVDYDHAVRSRSSRAAATSSRYEQASQILTSDLPFSGWGEVFGDQAVAASMIDRVVHHADVLTLKAPATGYATPGIDTLSSIRTQDTAD